MSHGLLWLPLLVVFPLLTALGWLERRRQRLFRAWAEGAELAKLDDCGGAGVAHREALAGGTPDVGLARDGAIENRIADDD